MRSFFYRTALSLSAIVVLLPSCQDKDFGGATPEAAAQYAEMIEGYNTLKGEEWLEEELPGETEVNTLIVQFDRTADARFATPQSGLTMLHLACMFKKEELVRCLLADGADPNARTRDAQGLMAATPLRFAIAPGIFEGDTDAKTIAIVDLLIKNGANAGGEIEHELGLMATAAHVTENEAVARHLLQYSPELSADDIHMLIERGWANLIEDIFKNKEQLTDDEKQLIVSASQIIKGHYDGKINQQLIDLFLNKGVSINTVSANGLTPLLTAAGMLGFAEDEKFKNLWLDFICYLLSKGADSTIVAGADSPLAGMCAYDLLANREGVLQTLAEKGQKLTEPPLAIRSGEHLTTDLSRAGMRRMTAEAARPYLEQIKSIFTPTKEQMSNVNFDTALLSAAEILQRINPQLAAEVMNDSPIWKIAPHLHDHEDMVCHHVSAASLIYILQEVRDVCVDRSRIMQVAQQAMDINDTELAAQAVELLGRDPSAVNDIESLCNSPHIAIRAGAWGAKLQQMGLPRSTNGAVKDWLAIHNRQADTPVLQTVLLATSLEDVWYNNMTPERKKEFIQALQTIGAPPAAIKVYGEYAENMDNPEKLDKLEALGKDWRYELEIATARYISAHAAAFLSGADSK